MLRKKRVDVCDVGKESYIHWNGPPVHMCNEIADATLDLHFEGRKWHFVKTSRGRNTFNESTVIHRLQQQVPNIPFFHKLQ